MKQEEILLGVLIEERLLPKVREIKEIEEMGYYSKAETKERIKTAINESKKEVPDYLKLPNMDAIIEDFIKEEVKKWEENNKQKEQKTKKEVVER